MSRVGNAPISLPKGVTIDVTKGNMVTVKGPKENSKNNLTRTCRLASRMVYFLLRDLQSSSVTELYMACPRALLNNMVVGVSDGFTKTMELVGVGYRLPIQAICLELIVGYSHPIFLIFQRK